MSTSYRIIENHGGHITVDNPDEAGAVFTITLPVRKPRKLSQAA